MLLRTYSEHILAPPLSGLRMRTLSGGARHFVEKQHLREDPIPPPHLHALKINNRTLRTTPYPDSCSNKQSALSTGRKSALLAICASSGIAPVASLPPPRLHHLASLDSLPSPRCPPPPPEHTPEPTPKPTPEPTPTLAKLAGLGSVRFRAEVRELQRAVDGSAACANDAELTGLTGHA